MGGNGMMIAVVGGGALLCFVLSVCVAGLVWFYKDDLFGSESDSKGSSGSTPGTPQRVPGRFTADTKDGKGIFACQTRHEDHWVPGETSDGYNKCVISYGGARIDKDEIKVLRPKRAFTWKTGGSPVNLVEGGTDKLTKRKLFVCRAKMDDGLWHIGKSLAGSKKCWLFTETPSSPERTFDEPNFEYAVYNPA